MHGHNKSGDFMKKMILSAAAFALLFPFAVQAQTAEDLPRKAALRFLEASGTKKNLERTIHDMVKMQVDQNPQLEPYSDVMTSFLQKYLGWDALKDDLVKIYSDSFSAEELNQLAVFYETDLGKKVAVKFPELMMKGSMLGQNNVQKHMAELQDAIQKRRLELEEKEAANDGEKKTEAAEPEKK